MPPLVPLGPLTEGSPAGGNAPASAASAQNRAQQPKPPAAAAPAPTSAGHGQAKLPVATPVSPPPKPVVASPAPASHEDNGLILDEYLTRELAGGLRAAADRGVDVRRIQEAHGIAPNGLSIADQLRGLPPERHEEFLCHLLEAADEAQRAHGYPGLPLRLETPQDRQDAALIAKAAAQEQAVQAGKIARTSAAYKQTQQAVKNRMSDQRFRDLLIRGETDAKDAQGAVVWRPVATVAEQRLVYHMARSGIAPAPFKHKIKKTKPPSGQTPAVKKVASPKPAAAVAPVVRAQPPASGPAKPPVGPAITGSPLHGGLPGTPAVPQPPKPTITSQPAPAGGTQAPGTGANGVAATQAAAPKPVTG